MKKFLFIILAVVMVLALAACGGSEPAPEESGDAPTEDAVPEQEEVAEDDAAYVKDKGSLVIGYTVYAPMNYNDENGELTGFDTELAIAVTEKLGVEPEFVVINWDTKEIELAGKSIDAIWNGMTLTEERMANMACTDPYVKNAQVVVVKEGTEYTDTSSLIGKTVVAELGSAGEAQVNGAGADANLAQAEFVGKGVQVDAIVEVKAGTADAAIVDLTLAKATTGEGTDFEDLKIVDYLAEEEYGIAFRQGSNLRDEVNVILEELRADGTLQTLADKYNLELAD